jgi:transcriptional regulator with XRE-family HTH domain
MSQPTNRIRALRKKMGLTSKHIAERLNTTQATVTRIETGKQTLSPVWIGRFAEALGVDESEILRSVSTTERIPVIGGIRLKKSKESPLHGADDIYNIPVPSRATEGRVAFEYENSDKSYYITIERTPLAAANHIGQEFITLHCDDEKGVDLAPRVLTSSSDGLYLVCDTSEPPLRNVRLDDPRVTRLWLVTADYTERGCTI